MINKSTARNFLVGNIASANRTARRMQKDRDTAIRNLRKIYSAIEIADITGLSRQRIHQILNEGIIMETSTNDLQLIIQEQAIDLLNSMQALDLLRKRIFDLEMEIKARIETAIEQERIHIEQHNKIQILTKILNKLKPLTDGKHES